MRLPGFKAPQEEEEELLPPKKEKKRERREKGERFRGEKEEKDPYRFATLVFFLIVIFVTYIFWVMGN